VLSGDKEMDKYCAYTVLLRPKRKIKKAIAKTLEKPFFILSLSGQYILKYFTFKVPYCQGNTC
jgi:hypothetical protein